MDDLGPPASYLVLERGTDVYSSDGERVGHVVEVRADTEKDIFDGLVIDRRLLFGGHRYVTADRVEEIYERGVLLGIDAAAVESLPESG
jgi:uncharacterized protein YrrD